MSSNRERKRKRIHLTHQQKIEIHQKANAGVSLKEIAVKYKIHTSTVRKIKRTIKYESVKEGINLQRKSSHSVSNKYKDLDDILNKWYVEEKESGNKITHELLYTKAKEIINNVGTSSPKNLSNWLEKFIHRYNIQLHFSEFSDFPYKQVDQQLLNWLLEQIIKRDNISQKKLKEETHKLMDKFGETSIYDRRYRWLNRFKKCHEILTKPDILQNFDKKNDATNLPDLDEQLLKWLIERKKSGDIISHKMLIDKTSELMGKFSETLTEKKKQSWLWRIKNRYQRFRIKKEILQKDNDIDQPDAETSIENVIEENIVLEEKPKVLSFSGKSGREEYPNPQQNIVSVEITDQSDAETSFKIVIKEDVFLGEIPNVLSPSRKSGREEYLNQQQNIVNVEITDQSDAETSTKYVIEEDTVLEGIPEMLSPVVENMDVTEYENVFVQKT
ncbi:uncharacterized protein [Anoplolepis gracilipes]|uniref:uncharacterized protein n=1 Tax=Anoplolepis gracilipes TaxID=354296 RepID=UPI003BA3B1C4